MNCEMPLKTNIMPRYNVKNSQRCIIHPSIPLQIKSQLPLRRAFRDLESVSRCSTTSSVGSLQWRSSCPQWTLFARDSGVVLGLFTDKGCSVASVGCLKFAFSRVGVAVFAGASIRPSPWLLRPATLLFASWVSFTSRGMNGWHIGVSGRWLSFSSHSALSYVVEGWTESSFWDDFSSEQCLPCFLWEACAVRPGL